MSIRDAAATGYDVFIVEAGHGGAQAAIAFRQAKFDGSILWSATSPTCLGSAPRCPKTIDSVNPVKDYVQGERLIESASSPDRASVVDPEVMLKDLV